MNPNPFHSFPADIAHQLGIPSALTLKYLAHRQRHSKQHREGKTWCFVTIAKIASQYPYLSRSTIATALKKLHTAGMIETGNFNKRKKDRTTWYHVREPFLTNAEVKPHKFASDIASQHGLPAAVIFQNLRHWTGKSHRRGKESGSSHELSPTKLAEVLPYVSLSTIKRALVTLTKAGLVEKTSTTSPHYKIPDTAYEFLTYTTSLN